MAFIQAIPIRISTKLQIGSGRHGLSTQRRAIPRHAIPRASAKPEPPANFSKPEPKKFYIRPDKLADMAGLSLGAALRLGNGVFIEGYRVRRPDSKDSTDGDGKSPKIEEYSATLPSTRPVKPLHLFEYEACPFCRKVREAITLLDLDVIVFPCPKGGSVYRPYVAKTGGKAQFPYLEDPNTGYSSYESDTIMSYLYQTYGPPSATVPLSLSGVANLTAGLASVVRAGKGSKRKSAVVPAKKIVEFWGYEPSSFCKLAREALNDLEIAHLLHTTARGSPTRAELKELTGRFQVPYIVDKNTGISMFESAEITEYINATYGPDAPGAMETTTEDLVYMPGDALLETSDTPSLDPQPVKDEKLEEFCKDNPDADECRVYED